jgi:DsbC/DsbD-like thiol-disulfide interchange protein
MMRVYHAVAAAFLGLSLLSPGASAQEGPGRKAEAELISDRASVAPGETIHVALHMTMQPGWHIYWKNAGDAGLPPQLILNDDTGAAGRRAGRVHVAAAEAAAGRRRRDHGLRL